MKSGQMMGISSWDGLIGCETKSLRMLYITSCCCSPGEGVGWLIARGGGDGGGGSSSSGGGGGGDVRFDAEQIQNCILSTMFKRIIIYKRLKKSSAVGRGPVGPNKY
jgi:hypothetical protein